MELNTNTTSLTTYHNKSIQLGKKYFLILHDFRVLELTAGHIEPEKKSLTRFLTQSGVNKFLIREKNKLKIEVKEEIKEEIIIVKTEAELLEEKISALDYVEQLDYIDSQEDFDKWLNRNEIKIDILSQKSNGIAEFQLKLNDIIFINFSWISAPLPGCCGGREQRNHGGFLHSSFIKASNKGRNNTLLKYCAFIMESMMKIQNKNFGIISYVKESGNFTDPSGRIGIMLSHLNSFTKRCTFKNPNTGNVLDIYTINDNWSL